MSFEKQVVSDALLAWKARVAVEVVGRPVAAGEAGVVAGESGESRSGGDKPRPLKEPAPVVAAELGEGIVHRSGGAPKLDEFRRGEAANSSETALGGAPKSGEFRREYDDLGLAVKAAAGAAVGTEVQATVDARALTLGVGQPAPLAKRGRPATVTGNLAEQVCMLISIGFSRRQAAAYLGVSPQAIARAIERDPELGQEITRATELADLQPELTLMAEARKNWRAAAWYLQFRAKNPRPLSEEEKAERHQDRLAEERRNAEATRAWMDGMNGSGAGSSDRAPNAKVEVIRDGRRKTSRGK